MHHRYAAPLLAAALVAASSRAAAAEFCVHDALEFQAALTAAQANGEDDALLIVAGDYVLGTGLTFVSTEPHVLDLFGSLDDCASPGSDLGGPGSLLDGQHLVRPLGISNPNGSVRVVGLGFVAGTVDGSGAGLFIVGKDVIVSASRFFGNHSTAGKMDSGGAAFLAASEFLRFDDNLVFGNHAVQVGGVTLQLQGDGTAQAVANTIVGNLSDVTDAASGLLIGTTGAGTFAVANNIVWNNAAAGGSDFGALAPHDLFDNDIGVVMPDGVPAGTSSGERSVDPGFETCDGPICFDFELARSSPLVDAGSDQYEPLLVDLAGKPRVIGPHVDIGAFENDRIFRDGLDP